VHVVLGGAEDGDIIINPRREAMVKQVPNHIGPRIVEGRGCHRAGVAVGGPPPILLECLVAVKDPFVAREGVGCEMAYFNDRYNFAK